MSARRYIYLFTSALLVLAGMVIVLNRVIDPFWYYRDISIEGVNAVKTRFSYYERHVKPELVRLEQPASLIFGSSFAEIGFNPLHPALKGVGKSYNFALAGAGWDMTLCSMQFAIQQDLALRQIVVGIHPENMPSRACEEDIEKMQNPDVRAFLFSYDALQASINTILDQRKQTPSHTAEGMYFYTRGKPETASRFREYFARYRKCKIDHVSVNLSFKGGFTGADQLDLSGLRDLLRATQGKGITVKLVLYPRHALFFEQEYQCGNRESRWKALTQIASEIEKVGGDKIELWDFEGYHEIGTETITEAPNALWQDPGHFNYEVGDIMLDEMFGLKPQNMGELITAKNVPLRAERENKRRELYLQKHPEFLTQLESML